MGLIKIDRDMDIELTKMVATGDIVVDDILDLLDEYYSGPVTKLVLGDFTRANASKLSSVDFSKIANALNNIKVNRPGGKTALISSRDADYGMGRMFCVLAEIESVEVEYRTFRDKETAKLWLRT